LDIFVTYSNIATEYSYSNIATEYSYSNIATEYSYSNIATEYSYSNIATEYTEKPFKKGKKNWFSFFGGDLAVVY